MKEKRKVLTFKIRVKSLKDEGMGAVGWFTFEKSRSDAAAASMLRKRYRGNSLG